MGTVPSKKNTDNLIQERPHVAEFLARVEAPTHTRIIVGIDATASREATWDAATGYTVKMLRAATTDNPLEIQIVFYRGEKECVASRWITDANVLAAVVTKVSCEAGPTQIARVLEHARKEHVRQKIAALVFIGDACEESVDEIIGAAHKLKMPAFVFHEGESDRATTRTFKTIANATRGAWAPFDAGAVARLAELLRSVAAYATGGAMALADRNTPEARLLLTQMTTQTQKKEK
jgi:hypothetical protein